MSESATRVSAQLASRQIVFRTQKSISAAVLFNFISLSHYPLRITVLREPRRNNFYIGVEKIVLTWLEMGLTSIATFFSAAILFATGCLLSANPWPILVVFSKSASIRFRSVAPCQSATFSKAHCLKS
jgi:hypothetical protein